MAKNNNKVNKNAIKKEQHKVLNLVFIGYVFTLILVTLTFFHKIFCAIILFILFVVFFISTYLTLKNLKFRLRYLSIQGVFFLTMFASLFSVFLIPNSITTVGESLVVATTISIIIDIEFYKHMKEYIVKLLKDQKTKRDWWQRLEAIDMTFGPMIASTFALLLALVALMTFLLPYSILFIDISIFLVLFALVMPIELFAEDLFIQAQIIFESSE